MNTEKLVKKVNKHDNDIVKVNEQLDNKAKQSDLIVERKRIDNLTTLPEGSTMGDAELMDGRIGLGGKIFNNIGDAIRSQFGYINEKSNDLTFNYISGNNETSNLINYVSYYKKDIMCIVTVLKIQIQTLLYLN